MKKILHCIILYDNENEVYEHVVNLSNQSIADKIALVIVINKLGKIKFLDFCQKIKSIKIDSYIYKPDENLGYLGGIIYGYENYCKESIEKPKWVIISNTDIAFANNSFYEDFINSDYNSEVWCVVPSVYNLHKKSFDNPEYIYRCSLNKMNQLIYIFSRPMLAYLYENLAQMKGKFCRNKKTESKYIYSGKGCFMMIRHELAEILLLNKYKALMYSEESYVSEWIIKLDKKLYYDSKIEVIHRESTITSKLTVRKRAKFIAESLKIIRDEFYN